MQDVDLENLYTADPHLDGYMMPERVVQDLLTECFARLKEDPTPLEDIFFKLGKPTVRKICNYFQAQTIRPTLNYPNIGMTVPAVAIVNTANAEDPEASLLDNYMTGGLDGTGDSVNVIGQACQDTLSIFCLGDRDSNAVLWLYHVIKAIMLLNRNTLESQGLRNMAMNGQAVTLPENLIPESAYARILTLSFGNYFSVRVTDRMAKNLVVSLSADDGYDNAVVVDT